MARTELPNGVILPAEYSDDWYEDMTSNLTKLDDVIGSDSEKLNSNDVAFLRMSSAALTDGGTGNFSDLNSSNKLKTGDYVLDSGRKLYQVVSVDSTNETFTVGNSLFKITAESDLAPVAESGDYDDLDNKPDLNPYDQHIVNTDIHVTTADKTKWNNGVSQSYVLRYSSSSVTDNSTIAYSTLDNTDNIKSGDKILDVDGKLFEITAVDTTNQTVTVGSALIDLALDANVVHTNKNDNVSIPLNSTSAELGVTGGSTNITFLDKNGKKLSGIILGNYTSSKLSYARLNIFDKDADNNEIQDTLEYAYVSNNANAYLRVYRDNFCTLGSTSYRWKGVYATNYYYGANNVEFSTKFVTTDTAQTISGAKTFSEIVTAKVNGLTPSSLSMPSNTYVDISGYVTDLTGGNNQYTAPENGWVYVDSNTTISSVIINNSRGYSTGFIFTGQLGRQRSTLPVCKGDLILINVNCASLNAVRFIPCLGNI